MLKISKIKPIPKGGDKGDILNYRPISILSLFSKILEKIMCKRLNSYIEKNNILTKMKFGFRQGKSVEYACHTFLNNTEVALENKLQVVGLFLDLTKAYDVLNHQILLEKLEMYEIRGIANQWFQSYLSNRNQFVEITHLGKNTQKKYSSSPRKNLSGVSQGSVLGPSLFLLYINDLPNYIRDVQMVLYADDVNILVVDKDENVLNDKITRLMKHLEIWFNRN
jgi:hypothetical protein